MLQTALALALLGFVLAAASLSSANIPLAIGAGTLIVASMGLLAYASQAEAARRRGLAQHQLTADEIERRVSDLEELTRPGIANRREIPPASQ